MAYGTKNYREQGGDKWVIGGALEVKDGATVSGITADIPVASSETLGGVKVGAGISVTEQGVLSVTLPAMDNIADGTEETLLTQFNALLAALKAKGYMAST